MKKRSLNFLKLNKKSISNLQSSTILFGGAAAINSVGDRYTKCPLSDCFKKTK
ncbi:hypothetical protein [uncultured Kordia sp.]|uniref:hypothetical protein n=1 Tax=uncultured Kordia sp. TaxID=507699 RepID=UPI0026377867|nr:hypothetical protein [uncultured Kordia sp.]